MTDSSIYVDNAFPLFVSSDNLSEDNRNVIISEDSEKSPAIASASVNLSASSVTSVSISTGGFGYVTTPTVNFSSSAIKLKDPIYNWVSSTGITTITDINSVVYGSQYIAVGNNGFVGISGNSLVWYSASNPYSNIINFNDIIFDELDKFILCASQGKIVSNYRSFNFSNWYNYDLYSYTVDNLGNKVFSGISTYSSNLKKIKYINYNRSLVCVGELDGIIPYGVEPKWTVLSTIL